MRPCLTLLMVVFLSLVTGVMHADPPATASATQPTKLAAERADGLKKDIKNFTLVLYYYGPQDKPYYHLLLSVPPPQPFTAKTPFTELDAQITEEQAKKIIDHLATEGFLDRAEEPQVISRSIRGPKGPTYMLSLPSHCFEYLGWGLPMLQRLDGLRTVLDGGAAKDMDLLLGRLAGHREEWKKAAATQPASSKPVEKDGLQVTVTLPKATFAADELLKFTVQFKNVSEKPHDYYGAEDFSNWTIRFQQMGVEKTAVGRSWRLENTAKDQVRAAARQIQAERQTLKPGDTFDVPVDLDKGGDFAFAQDDPQLADLKPIKHLVPGHCQLVVEIKLAGNHFRDRTTMPGGEWTGTITTEPVEFEISDKAAATQP